MQKAKKYDWKDSNLALFGSDTEKKVSISLHYPHFCSLFTFFSIKATFKANNSMRLFSVCTF